MLHKGGGELFIMKRVSVLQDESDSVLQSGNWLNNGVNVVDATELCTLKWLRCQILILCIFYHNLITVYAVLLYT